MTNERNAEGLVIVGSDIGLLSCSLEAAEVNGDGVPQNLIHGTEYVLLDGEQADAYIRGEYGVRTEDEARHVGAYTLVFANPDIELPSITKGWDGFGEDDTSDK